MRQLTLEDLAPYLPHRLTGKARFQGKYDNFEINCKVFGLFQLSVRVECYDIHWNAWEDMEKLAYKDFKPILRPLSDINKPITVEGYNEGREFVPSDILCPKNEYKSLFDREVAIRQIELYQAVGFSCAYYEIVKMLFRWHFDINGLIDAGLAIDINTLK